MKHWLIILAFVLPRGIFAQYFTVDTFKGESPYNKEFAFIFPKIGNTANADVANEINKLLVKDVLRIDLGTQKYSIFENIWGQKELDLPAVSDFSFKVYRNDSKVFSISISATSCSANCQSWTEYYVFESSSGRRLGLSDLLTGAGMAKVADSVKAERLKRIETRMNAMLNTLAKTPLSPDDQAEYKQAIKIYTDCEKNFTRVENYSFAVSRELDVATFRCLPHGMEDLDKVDYLFAIPMSDWLDYLSDFGKSVLQ
jgi:hypothetical protein